MTLLSTNDIIRPAYIHPDRVAFQFCYASPTNVTAFQARTALKEIVANGRDLPGMALTFTMPIAGMSLPLRVKFTKPNRTKPFFFKVYLSPLTLLRSPLTLEPSKDGQANFLAMGQVSSDNTFVAERIAELLVLIETALHELANRLAHAVRPDGYSVLLEWRLHAIELCADLRTPDPGRVVNRAYEGIRTHFKNTIKSAYQSATAYQGVEGDSLMAWGFAQRGERIKAYEKTTKRVRIECSLDKHALDKVLEGSETKRRLSAWDDFPHLVRELARHAAERFGHLRTFIAGDSEPGQSPSQLIEMASKGFDRAFAESALLTLGRNGRLRRSFNPALVRAWTLRGILRRTCHGHYTVHDNFRAALMVICDVADRWHFPPPGSIH